MVVHVGTSHKDKDKRFFVVPSIWSSPGLDRCQSCDWTTYHQQPRFNMCLNNLLHRIWVVLTYKNTSTLLMHAYHHDILFDVLTPDSQIEVSNGTKAEQYQWHYFSCMWTLIILGWVGRRGEGRGICGRSTCYQRWLIHRWWCSGVETRELWPISHSACTWSMISVDLPFSLSLSLSLSLSQTHLSAFVTRYTSLNCWRLKNDIIL